MLKRLLLSIIITACTLTLRAQSSTLPLSAKWLRHVNLARYDIPPGNYSGITPIGNDLYAVITDKAPSNGFYIFEILLNSKGRITSVRNLGFRSDSIHTAPRDMEGIAYVPSRGTVFISAESDQQILEYTLDGQQTGYSLPIPPEFSLQNIQPNLGFEALTYSPQTHLFWTTTENSLRSDPAGLLRLQSFTEDLQPCNQYLFQLPPPSKDKTKARYYAHGVSSILALPDSSLLLLEREVYIPRHYLNTSVKTKIFHIHPPSTLNPPPSTLNHQPSTLLPQPSTINHQPLEGSSSHLLTFSNYEGMCLGPTLPDGTQTLLLITDSQNRQGNILYHLKDKIRVVLIR